jgi:outer membrane protein
MAAAKSGLRVSANGYLSSGNYSSIFPSSDRVDPANLLLVPNGSLADGNLMLMMPLYTSGLLQAEVSAARLMVSASQAEREEAELDVELQVADAYLGVVEKQWRSAAAQDKLKSLTEMVRVTTELVRQGHEIAATLQRVSAEGFAAQREERSALGEVAKGMLDLDVAMGATQSSTVSLTDGFGDFSAPMDVESLVAEALRSRPKIRSLRAQIRSGEESVRAAKAASRPQVYGVAVADAATQTMNRGSAIGLTVSVPLFDSGVRKSEVGAATAGRDKAKANLDAASQDVEREVRGAYVDLETASANVTAATEEEKAASADYQTVQIRVSSGKGIYLELLDALQANTTAQADLAEAKFGREIAYFRLMRAIGRPLDKELLK